MILFSIDLNSLKVIKYNCINVTLTLLYGDYFYKNAGRPACKRKGKNMRVLAIGAHPDDIEIECAGTLAKCVKRGDTVFACHLSDGDLGHVVIQPEELGLIRRNEAKKAGELVC